MSETLESQVDRLAKFILAEIDGEPSQSEGAVDTAIRLLRERKHIIPGADAVVTKESLLAAAHAYEEAHRDAVDTDDYEVGLLAGARAFVEAAGIRIEED